MKSVLKLIPVLLLVVLMATVAATTLAAPGISDGQQGYAVLIPSARTEVQDTGTVTDTEEVTGTEVVTGTEAMTSTEEVTGTEAVTGTEVTTETEVTPSPEVVTGTAAACAQDYVVQAGDTLGMIASQFLGSSGAYNAIVQATNAAAVESAVYGSIDDPNIITVGQTLCIPASAAGVTVTGTTAVTGTEVVTGEAPSGLMAELTADIPEGKGKLLVENVSAVDLVFDISGPVHDTAVIPPTGRQPFILDPGSYQFSGHQPGGAFVLNPGTFEITLGGVTGLSCSDSAQCVPLPLGVITPTETVTPTEATVEPPTVTETEAATQTETVTGTETMTQTEEMTATEAITTEQDSGTTTE